MSRGGFETRPYPSAAPATASLAVWNTRVAEFAVRPGAYSTRLAERWLSDGFPLVDVWASEARIGHNGRERRLLMSRGLRAVGIIVVALLLAVVMPASSGIGRGESSADVIIISPPPRLGLPVGQAVEVRYRVTGAATVLELWGDATLLAADEVQPGQEISHAWAPATPGPHCLTVRAIGEENNRLAMAGRCVAGLPCGSP